MRAAVYFALLAFYQTLLCGQTVAPSSSDLHAHRQQQGDGVGLAHPVRERRPNVLVRKAEVASRRAAKLRDKQTSKDLLAAARLFRASAELHGAAGSYE